MPGRPTMWIMIGQGPIALAVGAGGGGGGCLGICTLLYLFSPLSLSLSLGDGRIYTEILSQRAVKPEINQPTKHLSVKVVIIADLGQRQKSA